MRQPVLKVFSYLPNPRVWKALIAARLCGVEVVVVGDKPAKLASWLWDFDARVLPESERNEQSPYARAGRRGFSGTLFKTDGFLAAHPFGTVPAAFSPDGQTGIFESNSIFRAVARAGVDHARLYGMDDYEASRIDSFLDANLVFAREAQVYLLAVDQPTQETHARMAAAYEFYLEGVESALSRGTGYLAGAVLSIADISFVCDFAQFLREGHYADQLAQLELSLISDNGTQRYPLAYRHLLELSATEEFAEIMGTYLDWYRKTLPVSGRESSEVDL